MYALSCVMFLLLGSKCVWWKSVKVFIWYETLLSGSKTSSWRDGLVLLYHCDLSSSQLIKQSQRVINTLIQVNPRYGEARGADIESDEIGRLEWIWVDAKNSRLGFKTWLA